MSNQDELVNLVREIRDIAREREQAYRDHLAAAEHAYQAHRQQNEQSAVKAWVIQFCVIVGAVTVALLIARILG